MISGTKARRRRRQAERRAQSREGPLTQTPRGPALAKSSDRPANQNDKPDEKTIVLETFEVFGSKLLNMDIRAAATMPSRMSPSTATPSSHRVAVNLEDFLKQRLNDECAERFRFGPPFRFRQCQSESICAG